MEIDLTAVKPGSFGFFILIAFILAVFIIIIAVIIIRKKKAKEGTIMKKSKHDILKEKERIENEKSKIKRIYDKEIAILKEENTLLKSKMQDIIQQKEEVEQEFEDNLNEVSKDKEAWEDKFKSTEKPQPYPTLVFRPALSEKDWAIINKRFDGDETKYWRPLNIINFGMKGCGKTRFDQYVVNVGGQDRKEEHETTPEVEKYSHAHNEIISHKIEIHQMIKEFHYDAVDMYDVPGDKNYLYKVADVFGEDNPIDGVVIIVDIPIGCIYDLASNKKLSPDQIDKAIKIHINETKELINIGIQSFIPIIKKSCKAVFFIQNKIDVFEKKYDKFVSRKQAIEEYKNEFEGVYGMVEGLITRMNEDLKIDKEQKIEIKLERAIGSVFEREEIYKKFYDWFLNELRKGGDYDDRFLFLTNYKFSEWWEENCIENRKNDKDVGNEK